MAVENGDRARQLADEPQDESRGSWRVLVAYVLLIAGRALPVISIAVVMWSALTRNSWSSAPLDDAGFTTALLPNLAATLWFCFSLALPFILLPVGSTVLSTRDDDQLTVATVLGQRIVDLASARTWRASLPGRGVDMQIVLVRSRTGWAILAASNFWLDDGHQVLDGRDSSSSFRPGAVRRRARGWMLLMIWALFSFITFGVGGSAAGTF
ncbi:hypothetical protein GCM10023216_23820 [Isoptericola chiayiensis]|uniref:Uncharacterized protein n=1 Tax=Isoptericola chiayiensis TaxID=579446 RepID=A0ABP8YJQ8_9MICO|nr:hypothetical protein [Isoptericola chiayiensis]NOV99675.1 hypothetical protein [Isoptericola chiayiensis]